VSTDRTSDALLDAWTARAGSAIWTRLRDARSHAEVGRIDDATARLDELERDLVNNVLHPARERFYRDGFAMGMADLPPEIVDPDVAPSEDGARAAQRAHIGGRDHAKAVKAAIDDARHGLKLAAGTSWGDAAAGRAIHENWETRHRSAIGATMRGLLSDSQIALREAVSRIMIKPHLR